MIEPISAISIVAVATGITITTSPDYLQPVEKVVLLLSYREKKSSSTREKEYVLTQRSYRSGHS
jgi:hypothetical protein